MLAWTAVALAGVMVTVWAVSLLVRDASIVDIAWGPCFVLVGLVAALVGEGASDRRILLLGLVGIWGVRLGGYLAWRNLGHGEDYRY